MWVNLGEVLFFSENIQQKILNLINNYLDMSVEAGIWNRFKDSLHCSCVVSQYGLQYCDTGSEITVIIHLIACAVYKRDEDNGCDATKNKILYFIFKLYS